MRNSEQFNMNKKWNKVKNNNKKYCNHMKIKLNNQNSNKMYNLI